MTTGHDQHNAAMSVEHLEAGSQPGARTRTTGVVRVAGVALTTAVLLAAASVLAVAVLVPRLGGAAPYTVLTGSMQPAYSPGSMIVVRPVAADDVALGTVITFQLASGRPEVVTHRVVTIARKPDGELRFQTKGDANDAPDPQWVRPEQVRGALWYAVPRLGYVSELLTGEQRQRGVVAVAVVLLGYACVMAAGATRSGTGNTATCTGGTALVSDLALGTGTGGTIVGTAQGPVAPGASGTPLCFQVTFASAAPTSLQGKTATATITVTGTSTP